MIDRLIGVGVVRASLAMKKRIQCNRSSSLYPSFWNHHHHHHQYFHRRSLAVMVMGHGWTGALGTGRLDQYIAGHHDEEFHDNDMLPMTIYNKGPVSMAHAGWGHTAVIIITTTNDDDDAYRRQQRQLLLTGRVHDFQNLLRLHRMPEWMRNQITKHQQKQKSSSASSSSSYLDRFMTMLMQNFGASGGESSPVTRSTNNTSSRESLFGGTKSTRNAQQNSSNQKILQRDWQIAADMSILTKLTEISTLPNENESIRTVACSAGLTALVTTNGGYVYTFGVNSFGQCGVGIISNNIWQPTRVITTCHQNPSYAALLSSSSSSSQHHHLLETLTTTTTDKNDGHDDDNSSIVNSNPSSSSSPLTTPRYDQDHDNYDLMLDEQEEQDDNNDDEQYLRNITSIALGLQHGVCLNASGQVYCFGKGDRGQLGLGKFVPFIPTAQLVQQYCILQQQQQPPQHQPLSSLHNQNNDNGDNNKNNNNPKNPKPIYKPLGPVQQVAAGLLHTAALTCDNQVLLWGKNVLPPFGEDINSGKVASDANLPCLLHLPRTNHDDDTTTTKKVLQIACGSHHTSIMLEDGSVYGVGISSSSSSTTGTSSSSSKVPIFEPVLMIPPGLVEMPVRQFTAHMDRTTVVGASGQQVLQVQLQMPFDNDDVEDDNSMSDKALSSLSTSKLLWGDDATGTTESMSSSAYFTPAWMDRLLEHDPNVRVQEIHRGWLHTVIVTDHVDVDDNDETIKKINHDN